MPDPRERLGYQVEPRVCPPFSHVGAQRDGSGDDGGTLDRAIIAMTEDGREIAIGEIWAACPTLGTSDKTRIDAQAVAQAIVDTLNGAEG